MTGLSRSVLAERFADLVEIPPILYLAKWRMQLASGLLSTDNGNIAHIAAETGCESEAAFSPAFMKMRGVPPCVWRGRIRQGSLIQRKLQRVRDKLVLLLICNVVPMIA